MPSALAGGFFTTSATWEALAKQTGSKWLTICLFSLYLKYLDVKHLRLAPAAF